MPARSPTDQRHSSFVRHGPSLPRVVDERRRVKAVRLSLPDPNGGLAVDPRRSGLSVWIMGLIDDNGECHFLDNRWLWPRKAGAAIRALPDLCLGIVSGCLGN